MASVDTINVGGTPYDIKAKNQALMTYIVASGGDTASEDVFGEIIVAPCLVLDLSTATTYYDEGEGPREKITSGADIKELQDSLSKITYIKTINSTSRVGFEWVRDGVLYLYVVIDGQRAMRFIADFPA